MPQIIGIIPARYASTRFPAKALANIFGKPMIQHVYEQASKAKTLSEVVVATDHEKIFEVVQAFGGNVVMTSENHQSGTDRCLEAFEHWKSDAEFIINIQGDEPFIKPEQIDLLASILQNEGTEIATLFLPIQEAAPIFDPNVVKVVFNKNHEAIYFSRNPIPFCRGIEREGWLSHATYFKHIGIYAYRADILKKITQLPPSTLEKTESLEQLRWIENGYKIKIAQTEFESEGIDTPEDLAQLLQKKSR